MPSELVAQAITLIKAGQREQARTLLIQAIKNDPRDESGWLWLTETLPDVAQRIAALEQCLKINPDSQMARKGLERMRARKIETPPSAPLDVVTPPVSASQTTVEEPPAAGGEQITPGESQPPDSADQLSSSDEPPPLVDPATDYRSHHPKAARKKKLSPFWTFVIVMCIGIIAVLGIAGISLLAQYSRSNRTLSETKTLAAQVATSSMKETLAARTPTKVIRPSTTPSATAVEDALAREPSPSPTYLPSNTLRPSRTPTITHTPSATPEPLNLPAPVYFLTGLTGGDFYEPAPGSYQIWRLETDGETLTQISNEATRVDSFDISPADGSLAYLTGNQIILADPNGSNQRILVDGGAMPENWDQSYWTKQIRGLAWSPDGSQLAYGQNGVNVLTLTNGKTKSILKNDLPSAGQDLETHLYTPVSWSPDGTRLLARKQYFECGAMLVLPVAGGAPSAEFDEGDDLFIWAADSLALFSAKPVNGGYCGGPPGFWRVDAITGEVTTLVENPDGTATFDLIGWPHLTADGRLMYFYNQISSALAPDFPPLFSLYTSEADGVTGRSRLSSEGFILYDYSQYIAGGSDAFGSVIWSADDEWVVISAAKDLGEPQEFWLLSTDGGNAVKLAGKGRDLQWGLP